MNIDLSRRLATSTRPWSSTSPSTSSCRWCSARRSCTPTTSSSSRWLPSDAIAISFISRHIAGRLLWRLRPVHQPQRCIWVHQRRLQVEKFSFLRRCTGRHLNWRRVKSMAFYDREMLRTLQKLPSSWLWRWAKGEVNRIFSCHGILWTESTSPLADHFYEYHRPMLPTFPRKSWQIVVNIDFSTTTNCSFADSVIPFFLQLSRGGLRLTGGNNQPKFMFKWNDKKTPISPKV